MNGHDGAQFTRIVHDLEALTVHEPPGPDEFGEDVPRGCQRFQASRIDIDENAPLLIFDEIVAVAKC